MSIQTALSISAQIDALCDNNPIIPVITVDQAEDILPLARALQAGGVSVLEITLRSAAALDAIRLAKQELEGIHIGAGTVVNTAQLDEVLAAGAEFIVTPGLSHELLRAAKERNIPFLPGVATVSEIIMGLDAGFDRFKFFPAEAAGGLPFVKSLQGPFSQVRFCPTGGIGLHNFQDYLKQANVMAVGGSWIVPNDAVKNHDWQRITTLTQETVALLGR
ncbi:bifunctional 4-hydroxy-2-oxoglutarate aldolase/2-dehydro-3-deoxy-phosphogluconate aldolase [Balneatrix alpica]|uniref:2-dehydro-3-deoxy-phosphogluconate aldolase n=1 Tax=Balneatrix alpica TaxID=75684 RepID=A0ABV5ZCJ8_9GAMM|nr:bifunctional 4-hydroxy-2-oxoglutarate aldolase/2-dehydro-3-deoxy-phosphogluconate aldolase [Balneatrix alpica]